MFLLSIAFFLLPFVFLDNTFTNRLKKQIIFSFCIFFVILGGIRWNTGTDWYSYLYGFELSQDLDFVLNSPYSFEVGFGLLNYIVNQTFGSYSAFLFIFTFITIFLNYRVITHKYFIATSLFSFFLFYCSTIGNIVATRQALAVALTLYSIIFIIERKFIKFLILVLCATLIHRSAIIFLPAYYLFDMDLSQKKLTLIYLSGMLTGIILLKMTDIGLNIPLLSNINFLNSYKDKIESYNEIGQVTYGAINSFTINVLGYLKSFFIMIPMLYMHKDRNNIYTKLLTLVVFGSVIYFTLGAVSSEFKRLNAYYDAINILLLPYFISLIKDKKIRYFLIFLFSFVYLYRIYTALLMFWDLLDPFYTIFDENNQRQMY